MSELMTYISYHNFLIRSFFTVRRLKRPAQVYPDAGPSQIYWSRLLMKLRINSGIVFFETNPSALHLKENNDYIHCGMISADP